MDFWLRVLISNIHLLLKRKKSTYIIYYHRNTRKIFYCEFMTFCNGKATKSYSIARYAPHFLPLPLMLWENYHKIHSWLFCCWLASVEIFNRYCIWSDLISWWQSLIMGEKQRGLGLQVQHLLMTKIVCSLQ
jgi:hypothetical protein